MHHATTQATANETINAGHVCMGTTYSVLMNAGDSCKKQEETLQKLHEEAEKAWEDTSTVVFDHQLRYDVKLTGFITFAEKTLRDK